MALGTLVSCQVYNFKSPVGSSAKLTAAEKDDLQRAMPRPELRPDTDHIWVEVEKTYDVPPEEFWRVFRALPLDGLIEPTEQVPAIERVDQLAGEWHHPNARRRLVLVDGNELVEQIVTFDAPTYETPTAFSYVLWNFTSSARHAVEYATGRWQVTPVPEGTHVLWRYGIAPRSSLTARPARNFAENTFLPLMQKGLDNLGEAIEEDRATQGAARATE
ncbi:MAG: SRPBCC family protein [Planctomycetota bacterium]